MYLLLQGLPNTLKPDICNLFVTFKSTSTSKAFSFSENLPDQVCFHKQMLQSMKTTILTNSISLSRNPIFKSHSPLNGLWIPENVKYVLITSPVASHLMSCPLYLWQDCLISGYFSITLNSIYSGPHWFTVSVCGCFFFNSCFEKSSLPH